MPQLPKGKRPALKITPDPDAMLAELVRSLTVESFDALLVEGEDGKARLRVVNE